jgi:hypothetical protein
MGHISFFLLKTVGKGKISCGMSLLFIDFFLGPPGMPLEVRSET